MWASCLWDLGLTDSGTRCQSCLLLNCGPRAVLHACCLKHRGIINYSPILESENLSPANAGGACLVSVTCFIIIIIIVIIIPIYSFWWWGGTCFKGWLWRGVPSHLGLFQHVASFFSICHPFFILHQFSSVLISLHHFHQFSSSFSIMFKICS